jgi:hypothetical protein
VVAFIFPWSQTISATEPKTSGVSVPAHEITNDDRHPFDVSSRKRVYRVVLWRKCAIIKLKVEVFQLPM